MKYEIGQKVETEKGNGIIVAISGYEEDLYIVNITNIGEWGFNKHQLKPYKSAHECLLEMGYKVQQTTVLNSSMFTIYGIDGASITIIERKGGSAYKTKQEVSLELSRILTQYLEELNEK